MLSYLPAEIRICILSGKVDQAAELLNKHFPSVLSESTESVPAHRPAGKIEYIPSTSVHPAHLALNLHILAFIEAARTVPLPYYPPGTRPPSAINVSASSSKDTDMMRHVDSEQANVLLLHRAQNLHSEAYRLPDANDRALYLTELTQVGGVLAYTVPERGPMAKYMTQERREAVADQIESAILCMFFPSSLSGQKQAELARISQTGRDSPSFRDSSFVHAILLSSGQLCMT